MYFKVDSSVFEKLPQYCLGVVIAKGIDNSKANDAICRMLDSEIAAFSAASKDINVRELPNINACRDAFSSLSMNPNKFMCSIEALTKRVQKSAQLPHINPVVDIGNAFSVKYQLPMGAHDIDKLESDMEVRFSTTEDHFLGIGEEQSEAMPEGELVYVSGHTVKTRRWIWRQSDDGKITEETNFVFFPIDGFKDVGYDSVIAARDGLAAMLETEFGCKVKTGFIDSDNLSFELTI